MAAEANKVLPFGSGPLGLTGKDNAPSGPSNGAPPLRKSMTDTSSVRSASVASQRSKRSSLSLGTGRKGSSGTDSLEMMVKHSQKFNELDNKHGEVKKALLATFTLLILSVILNAIAVFAVVADSKENHTSKGILETLEGDPVSVAGLGSFSTLLDLPAQNLDFINSMREVTVVLKDSSEVHKYTVDGFVWHDKSSIVLNTGLVAAPDTGAIVPQTIVINSNSGQAWVQTGTSKHFIHLDAVTDTADVNLRRRHLEEIFDGVSFIQGSTMSWKQVMEFDAKLRESSGQRRLNTGNALSDLYIWLGGGLIKSESDPRSGGGITSAKETPAPEVPKLSRWEGVITGNDNNDHTAQTIFWMDTTDVAAPQFHTTTIEASMVRHDVFTDGFHYEYFTVAQEMECPTSEVCDAAFAKRDNCVVSFWENAQSAAEAAAAGARVLEIFEDGSASWEVGGWIVTIDAEGNPTNLAGIDITSITEYDASSEIVVTGVGLYDTCDPDKDYETAFHDAFLAYSELTEEDIDRRLQEDPMAARFHGRRADEHRRLSWTSFQAWISNTNWCGAGTDTVNTVCPSSSASGDLTADRACRRHDHGAKANGIIGGFAVRLGCDIDHDLSSSTDNWCAQGIFGSYGLAQTWGCFDHGSYSCWNWKSIRWGGYWRYGVYCHGEHTHSGPWRYGSYSHRYGYRSKNITCPGDIW